MLPFLRGEHAYEVQSFGVRRFNLQHLRIELLGVAEASGLMILPGKCKSLGSGGHGTLSFSN